jgi:membrane protein involved in colicin uptake
LFDLINVHYFKDPNAAPAVVQEKQPPPPAIQQQKRSTAGNVATPSPAAAARKAVDLDIFDMFGPSTTGGDAAQKGQKRQSTYLT